MSDPFLSSIQNLRIDTKDVLTYGSDTVDDINPPKEVESVEFSQDPSGKYSKDTKNKDSNIVKDIKMRQDETDLHEKEVDDFIKLARTSDDKLLALATQINQRKHLIISKINEAVSAGCSVGIGTTVKLGSPAIVNGVEVGIGLTVTEDFAYIKKYAGLDNYTGGVPFSSDDVITLSSSNTGKGYFSGFTENGGPSIGTYYTISAGISTIFGIGSTAACQAITNEIVVIAAEIADLRSQIDYTLMNKINKVKDRKTESEVFLWGYKSRDHKIETIRDNNDDTINTIESI